MAFALHENALIALTSAASWGGGDFSGGMGVKASGGRVGGAIRFVILAHAISLVVLIGLLWARGAGMPHGAAVGWSVVAGVMGALGLVAFYIALSRGGMGVSAAVSGLLAAAIPAVVSSVMEGAPTGLRLTGFGLAGAAIWMIAAGDSPENLTPKDGGEARSTMALAIFAGVAFGIYFVALKMANPLGLMMPMAIARASSVTLCAVTLGVMGLGRWLRGRPGSENPDPGHPMGGVNRAVVVGWACGVALLDTGGNLLFMEATRLGRLDVASVLASLYPAGTILLAAWYLHERPTRRQGLGMAAALAAVVMITV
ncbi:MAG: EamA family transporter [Acidobacteriaceae bacterium]